MGLDLYTRELKEGLMKHLVPYFKFASPMSLTLAGFVFGLLSAYCAMLGLFPWAISCWVLNRLLDGLDGTIARQMGQQSDFGGYVDIICDFTVYGLIPIGIVANDPSKDLLIVTCLLEVTYFVNAAGLFYLSAILEKVNSGLARRELTSVTMPPALIEGTETIVFYTLFLLIPQSSLILFSIFALGVTITIIQRIVWASRNLPKGN